MLKTQEIKTTLLFDFPERTINEGQFCARVQHFISQRHFYNRKITNHKKQFLQLQLCFAHYFSQIFTTCFNFHKYYIFQFERNSLVWKSRNKIYVFKKIAH